MKPNKIILSAICALAMWLGTPQARATVVFSITPAAISNTYNGPIILSVTGLTNTETVVIQKFLDANTNGVIDAGDLLWQQFNLSDGTNFVIGGVTNNNVPGDTDGTVNGTITARLNFQSDFLQTFDGKYLVELSSPVGHFAPITNSFTVTNFPYAQKFTGTVVSNGVAVPNAVVILFPSNEGNPAGGAVANNSGIYTLPAATGTYSLVAVKSNFVANFNGAANVVLNSSATFVTNLSLMAATQSISGKIVDANNSSIGLPGLLVPVQTQDRGLLAVCFTDTNGNFTTRVTANQWGISSDSAALAFHGYVGLNDKTTADTTGGSVSGVTIALHKGTALFYGTVKDNLGNPLPGSVAIYAQDNNQNDNGNSTYQSDGYTDTNGNYVAVVVGGLGSSDPWQPSIDNASSWPNYIFSQSPLSQNGGTNMTVGKVVRQNFTAILATNHIAGNVQFNGAPVSGVTVNANATIGGTSYQAQTDTDSSGNYSLNVANGAWSVSLNCDGGDSSLDNILGGGNFQCPDSQDANIGNNNATGVNFVIQPTGGSYQIFGYVLDNLDNAVSGVEVDANDGVGDVYSGATDDTGYYSINVGNGNWDVSVDCGELSSLNYDCPADQNVNVSGNSVEQDFTVQSGRSGPLGITTTSLPDGIVNGAYSQQLNASGGQSPYSWSLTPGSLALPGGIILSTSGVISGTPTNAPFGGTNFYFSVRVTDNSSSTADQLLSLTIYPAFIMATNALPNGTNGTAYSVQILVSGGDPNYGGFPVYGEYLSSGSLPPGLNLSFGANTSSNEFFVISGSPTNSGTYPFTLGAIDADGNQVQNNYSITIAASSLQITTAALTNANAGVAYTNQLQGSGGTTPYIWTIALGSQPLPGALTLSTNGLISGVPTTGGTNTFIVRLTDHNSVTLTHSFTLVVNPKPILGSPAWAANQFQMRLTGAANQGYTVQMSTNLSSTSWVSLFVTNNPTTNSFILSDPSATNKQRFYRILIGP